ncbi:LADA_0D10066g1_1 [Lachancea dasiensis]|uniref:LADA_0D10066g1_1 n=1 Tax=Lachancea dasiensis TaxID=1072105 RepID=A0A1G4J7P8_9SACH|nr:LADA_0D10066g1_1 [Lachancea dasiensis]
MSASRREHNVFSTPVKKVSGDQLKSVRERIGRESPYLYRNKQLPEHEGNNSITHSPAKVDVGSNTPVIDRHMPKVNNELLHNAVSGEAPTGGVTYENPVLAQYSRRIVNKELETRRIISNFLALLLWNLGVKFLSLFLYHTTHGANLQQKLGKWVQESVIFRFHPHADLEASWARNATLANISHVCHLLIFYNVTVSIWRLLVKSQNVKVDDLHLNHRQRQLLGVSDTPVTKELLPHVRLASGGPTLETKSTAVPKIDSREINGLSASSAFLFKSLQTPQKAREQQVTAPMDVRSDFVKKVNAFGDLRTSFLKKKSLTPTHNTSITPLTPVSRNGYIPSSKYTYMHDTPSPRKRI